MDVPQQLTPEQEAIVSAINKRTEEFRRLHNVPPGMSDEEALDAHQAVNAMAGAIGAAARQPQPSRV